MPAPIRSTWYNRPGWSEYKAARGGGQKHWGYDSYTVPRATIYAIGTGEVVAKGYAAGGFGHYIDVYYPGLNVRQREAHMNEESHLDRGAQVTPSTALGRVGRTGNAKNIYWIRNGVELWHVHSQAWRGNTTNGDNNVDPRNYWGGTAGNDITPIPTEEQEEDEMKPSQVHWTRKSDGKTQRALFVPGTAYWLTWQETGATIANGFARNVPTGSSSPITENMARAMENAAKAMLPKGSDLGTVTVEVNPQELSAALQAGLADEFAAIPGAVADEQAARLSR